MMSTLYHLRSGSPPALGVRTRRVFIETTTAKPLVRPRFDRTWRLIECHDLDQAAQTRSCLSKARIAGRYPAPAALGMVPIADAGGGSIHGRGRFCYHDAARAAAHPDLRYQYPCL